MGRDNELDRLDALGKRAAKQARAFNHAMNHRADHTARHAAADGTGQHFPVFGRLMVPLALILLFSLALGMAGVSQPGGYAFAMVVVIEALYFVYRRRRQSRLLDTGSSLQAQLHNLKQQEFALRYEEAKQNGQLDQFSEPEGR